MRFCDGVAQQPLSLLRPVVPLVVGLARRVGIGEEHDAATAQREQGTLRQARQPASGQPQILGAHLAHDDCRLLGLHHGHDLLLVLVQQVQPEETVRNGYLQGTLVELAQHSRHPGGLMVMVSVTVLPVVHNLAVVHLSQHVNLPEDDTTVATHAQPIAPYGTLHLTPGQVARSDAGSAELALVTDMTVHQVAVGVQYQVVCGPLFLFPPVLLVEPAEREAYLLFQPWSLYHAYWSSSTFW